LSVIAAMEDAMAADCDWLTPVAVGQEGVLGRRRAGPFFAGKIDRRSVSRCGRGAMPRRWRHRRGPPGSFVVEFCRQAVAVGLQLFGCATGLG
jgi:hypothetical protein